jgi:hypothetical protein
MGQMHAKKMNYVGEIGEFFRGGVKDQLGFALQP